MSNPIEQLNFDVILKDDNFNKTVNKMLDTAKSFNSDLSKLFDITAKIKTRDVISSKGVTNAMNMLDYLTQIEQKVTSISGKKMLVGDADALNETLLKVLEKMDKMVEKGESVKKGVTGINNELAKSHGLMSELTQLTGITFGVAGLRNFLTGMVRISGEFEVQKMALTSMLQSADKADEIFNTLRKSALESPYTFQDLTKYAKQLTAFNIGTDQLVETEKRLADVAAGLGVDMGRIILAYGQVKAAGVLKGTELRQFTEAGVPLLQSLAEQIKETEGNAISLSEVFARISKKQIPFEMVEEAFRRMTSEGGKFYNMQEVLVETLQGKIGKLRDVWQQAMYDIGQSNSGLLKGAVDKLTNFIGNLAKFGDEIGALIQGVGVYAAALTSLGVIAGTVFGIKMILNIKAVVAELWAATSAATALSGAMGAIKAISIALAAVVSVAVLVAAKIKRAREEQERYNEAVAECTSNIASEKKELDRLMKIAQDETKSIGDRKKAIDKINTEYADYINNLGMEKVAVNNLKTSYDNLTSAIANNYLERMRDATVGVKKTNALNAESELVQYVQSFVGDINKNRGQNNKISAQAIGGIMSSVQGVITNRAPRIDSYGLANLIGRELMAGGVSREEIDANKLLRYTEDIVNSSEDLRRAEKNFEEFQKGYTKSLGIVLKTDEEAEEQQIAEPSTWGANTKGNDKVPKWLKDRIDQIKELQTGYKELTRDGQLSEEEVNQLINAYYSWMDASLRGRRDFWAMLSEQADLMEQYDEHAANALRGDISRGQAKEKGDELKDRMKADKEATKEAEKALKEYQQALAKFDKDWGSGDKEGASNKLEKLVRDYNNEDKKIDEEYIDAQMKAFEAHKDNADAIKEETDKLYKLYQARKKANQNKFRESVKGLADDIFKEQMQGFDLTNWNDKTISQIKAIREAIKKVEIPEDIKKDLEGDTEAAEALLTALNQLKQKTLNNTVDPEMFKKVSKEAKRIAGYLNNAATKMREFAEATGNSKLGETAEIVGILAQNMQAAADGAESWGGWWGAIIGGVTDLLDQMTTGFTDAIKKANELSGVIRGIKDDAWIASNVSMFSGEGIFGENALKDVRGASEAMRNIREDMEAIGDPEITRNGITFWEKVSLGFRLMHNREHIAPEEYIQQGGLRDVMQRYGLNVYDQYGNLDPASIRKVIEMFGDESGVLERLAKDSEAYAEAMKTIEDVSKSLVGSVVEDLSDKIVDTWWEAGSAALNYADILEDVAKAYAKLIVNDMLLQSAFDEQRQEAFKQALQNGDAATAMGIVEQAMQSAQDMLPAIESALSVFEPYRNMAGGDTNSVGSGIKSITEETANLLASYINAIRADVSYIRVMQERGWESVTLLGASVPTLNEYLAQIAGTNFDIAQSNQSILSELRSVIGAPGTTGMVVRVESY